jgi:hypothetical protein
MTARKPRAYVSGKMRGVPFFGAPMFDAAEAELRALGYIVFNPARQDRKLFGRNANNSLKGDPAEIGIDVRRAIRADLEWICQHADLVVTLPNWRRSKGARAEVATAHAIGIPVVALAEILAGAAA